MDEIALDCIRKAGRAAAEAREMGAAMILDGAKLSDVAIETEALIVKKGARLAFPCNISINDMAAHFTPNSDDTLRFKNGDVVKLDVGAHVEGWIGDTARTVEVGSKNWSNLIMSSERALTQAIEMTGDGTPVGAIGATIERSIKSAGHRPVVNLNGHEMKKYILHAGLSIPNYDDGNGQRIKEGMLVAIEPFATNGKGEVINAKMGNIYRVMRDRPLKDEKAYEFFQSLRKEFNSLPFCERWCEPLSKDCRAQLRLLLRHGLIIGYNMLVEMGNGMVSQCEHTVVIRNGRAEITTLAQ
jgi:methionyl aminopeptidase